MEILVGILFVFVFGVLILGFAGLSKEAALRVRYKDVFTGNKANFTVSAIGAGLFLTFLIAGVLIFMPEELEVLGDGGWVGLLVTPLVLIIGILMFLGIRKRCPAELKKGLGWNLVLVAMGYNMRKVLCKLNFADTPQQAYAKAEMEAQMNEQNLYR